MPYAITYALDLVDGQNEPWKRENVAFTTSGSNYQSSDLNASTTPATVALGSVVLGGLAVFKNLSTTVGQDIHIRVNGGGTNHILVPPGRTIAVYFPAAATSLDYVAAAGTPLLRMRLYDP